MIITSSEEMKKRFEEIHSKMLNKEFVSAGTLLRFRDCCVKVGYYQAKKEELEFWDKQVGNYIPDILDKLRRRVKQLQEQINRSKA